MSKETQDLFTSIAPRYDLLNHLMSFSIDRRWREKAVASLAELSPNRLLDLCAGTLDLSKQVLDQFPTCQVFAADFSLAMLRQGEKKIEAGKPIHRICADGHHLPFSDGAFDAVVCGFGIRNLEDRERAAREIRRLLRRGGKLVVLEFFRPEKTLAKLFYQTYGRWVLPQLGGALSRNKPAYEYLWRTIQNFLSVEEYGQFLQVEGFKVLRTQSLSGGIAHLVVAEVSS